MGKELDIDLDLDLETLDNKKDEILESLREIEKIQKEAIEKNEITFKLAKELESYLSKLLTKENREILEKYLLEFKEVETRSLKLNDNLEKLSNVQEKIEELELIHKKTKDLLYELKKEEKDIVNSISGAYDEELKKFSNTARKVFKEFKEKVKTPKNLIYGSVALSFLLNVSMLGYFISYKNEIALIETHKQELKEFNNYIVLMKDYKTFKEITNERINNLKN